MRSPIPCTLGLQAPAAAQQPSPYTLGVARSLTTDSNLLRLANGQAVLAGYSRSDTLSTTALIGGIDQAIGRQRVYGNATLRANRLSKNRICDNKGYALGAGLDWSTVNRLSSSLSASANRSLGSLNSEEIGLVTRKDLQNVDRLSAGLRPGLVTRVTAKLNLGRRRVRHSLDQRSVRARDFTQATGKLSWITLLNRDTGKESYAVQSFKLVGTSDYSRVNTTLTVQAGDQVSAKIALTASVLGFDRGLVRTLFGWDLSNDRRNGSGQLATDLRSDRFSCYAQLSLQ